MKHRFLQKWANLGALTDLWGPGG